MAKMGFCIFTDGYYSTDVVAPKSDYPTKEDFIKEAVAECEGYEWEEKVSIENITESFCRFFPAGVEGWEGNGGCYSFSKEGTGAFPVWRIALQR